MAYAHQGIELKPLPGIPAPVRHETVAESEHKPAEQPPPRPALLTKRGADVLVRVERMMDAANKALVIGGNPPDRASRNAALAKTDPLMSELESAATIHGAGN
jgi:penicillin-binding protein 1A